MSITEDQNANQDPLMVATIKLEPEDNFEDTEPLKIIDVFSLNNNIFTETEELPEANSSTTCRKMNSKEENTGDSLEQPTVPESSISFGINWLKQENIQLDEDSFNSQSDQEQIIQSTDASFEHLKNIPCDLCSEIFFSYEALEEHVIDVHVMDKEFNCPECSKSFISQDKLESHILEHGKRKREDTANFQEKDNAQNLECEYCKVNYKTLQSFRHHKVFCSVRLREYNYRENGILNLSSSLEELQESAKIKADIGMLALRVLCRKNKELMKGGEDLLNQAYLNIINSEDNLVTRKVQPQPSTSITSDHHQHKNKDPLLLEDTKKAVLSLPEQPDQLAEPKQLPSQQRRRRVTFVPTQQQEQKFVYPPSSKQRIKKLTLVSNKQHQKSLDSFPSRKQKKNVPTDPFQLLVTPENCFLSKKQNEDVPSDHNQRDEEIIQSSPSKMRRKEKQAPVDLINRKGEEQMQTSPSKMRRKEVPVDHIKLEEDSMLSSSSKMIRTEIPVDHIKQEEDSIQPSPSKKRKKEVTTALTPQHETSLQTDGLNRISLRLPEDPDTSRIQTDIGILALRVLSRKNNKVTNQRDLIRSTFINLYNSKNKASRTLPKEKVISNQNQQRNKKFDPVPFKQKRKVGLPVHEKQKKLMEQLPSVQLKKEETLAPTHQKSHT